MHFYSEIWIINLYSPVKYWLDQDLQTTLIPVNDVDDYYRMSVTGITKLSRNVTKICVGDWASRQNKEILFPDTIKLA